MVAKGLKSNHHIVHIILLKSISKVLTAVFALKEKVTFEFILHVSFEGCVVLPQAVNRRSAESLIFPLCTSDEFASCWAKILYN